VVSDLAAVMGRLGPFLRQQAYVVDDLEAAKASMRRSFGCTKYFGFESTTPWQIHAPDGSSRTVQCDLGLAFGRSGNMMIELIQPLRGEGVHFDLLTHRGPGAHHHGYFVDDYDGLLAAAIDDGYPPVMSGVMGNSRFAYLDTVDEIGVYLELIHDPDKLVFSMMPWWDDPRPTAEDIG
jgi:hypothetical protein